MAEPDDQSWLPFVAGVGGLIAGAGLGWWAGIDDGSDNALKLSAVGGFIGMVLVVVPVNSRLRARSDSGDEPGPRDHPSPDQEAPSLLARLFGSRYTAKVPEGGLPTRPVPNRNSEVTGHVEGGVVVRVVRRSGNWARIESDDEGDPVWLERRRLEPE